jgi:hypothetical protein
MRATRNISAILVAAASAGCSSSSASNSSGSRSSNDLAVDQYDAPFHFAAPSDCTIFVFRRLLDARHFGVEYDVRVGADPLSIVYRLSPGDPLPLSASVAGGDGTTILSLRASDASLRVSDSVGTDVLDIEPFPERGPPTVSGAPMQSLSSAARSGLAALTCLLPAQRALGDVPDFLAKNRSGQRASDGTSSQSTDVPQLVPWRAPVTLLGALWVAATGIRVSADGTHLSWAPSCGAVAAQDDLVGPVTIDCASP